MPEADVALPAAHHDAAVQLLLLQEDLTSMDPLVLRDSPRHPTHGRRRMMGLSLPLHFHWRSFKPGSAGPRIAVSPCEIRLGATGFEPATSCSQSRRATGLRHAPLVCWPGCYDDTLAFISSVEYVPSCQAAPAREGANTDWRIVRQRLLRRKKSGCERAIATRGNPGFGSFPALFALAPLRDSRYVLQNPPAWSTVRSGAAGPSFHRLLPGRRSRPLRREGKEEVRTIHQNRICSIPTGGGRHCRSQRGRPPRSGTNR